MSQQSTLKMMLPFYSAWMKKFPDVGTLSQANESEVLKMWEGLGYYSRARNILKAAQLIVGSGRFPNTMEKLLSLPGVGPYTASAISSICFDVPTVPVDGNVIRVLSRIFQIEDALNNPQDRIEIKKLASQLGKHSDPGLRGDFSQSLMELGATVCRPGTLARCEICPIQHHCAAYATGRVAEIPRAKLRLPMKKVSRLLLAFRNKKGELLLRPIPVGRSLANQWEIPHIDFKDSDPWIQTELGMRFKIRKAFSHTIMSTRYSVWIADMGVVPAGLPEHAPATAEMPVTSITRKAVKILG